MTVGIIESIVLLLLIFLVSEIIGLYLWCTCVKKPKIDLEEEDLKLKRL